MTGWKFSWGPFYNEAIPAFDKYPAYDPPHGDYYSKPSQPKYMSADDIISRDRAALIRQAYQEPTARRHYFWLGRNAENF